MGGHSIPCVCGCGGSCGWGACRRRGSVACSLGLASWRGLGGDMSGHGASLVSVGVGVGESASEGRGKEERGLT